MKKIIQKIILAGVVFYKGKALIVQRSELDDSFPGLWEIPGGKREFLEKSQDALLREIAEETGLKVNIIMPIDVFEFKNEKSDEIRDATQINFLCTCKSSKITLSNEHQDFAWIKEDELEKLNFSKETKKVISKAFWIFKKLNLQT